MPVVNQICHLRNYWLETWSWLGLIFWECQKISYILLNYLNSFLNWFDSFAESEQCVAEVTCVNGKSQTSQKLKGYDVFPQLLFKWDVKAYITFE